MSSPANTVNTVMQWLSGLLKSWLPTLPLSGVFAPFTALWELIVPGPLPDPSAPLPWNIPVTPEWTIPIDGVRLVPTEIAIIVSAPASPASDPIASSSATPANQRSQTSHEQ